MAGEIQLNSTTMATESSGSITAELDVIRPNTTNGSLTLQGDSSDAGVTGLTIDSSGVVNTTTAKVTNIQATSGQSLTIKDEDGNAAITVGTDNTAHTYLSLNFGSYHGDSGGAGSGTLTGNTLSDYETGTFTVTLSGGFSSAPTGYTSSYGAYTKIGNMVYCQMRLNADGAVANASIIKIDGLPFTATAAGSGSSYGFGVINYQSSFNTNAGDTIEVDSSGTELNFYTNTGAGRLGNASGVNINNLIILNAFYLTP